MPTLTPPKTQYSIFCGLSFDSNFMAHLLKVFSWPIFGQYFNGWSFHAILMVYIFMVYSWAILSWYFHGLSFKVFLWATFQGPSFHSISWADDIFMAHLFQVFSWAIISCYFHGLLFHAILMGYLFMLFS